MTTRHIELTDGHKAHSITLHTPRTLAEINDLFRDAVSRQGGNPASVSCWQAHTDPIAHVHIEPLPEHSGALLVA